MKKALIISAITLAIISLFVWHHSSPKKVTPQTPKVVATPTPTPIQKVALEVQGTELGDVIIQEGQNQCDVLSDALSQKVITFLSMKYFSSFDSFGVYMINDIGDPNTINFVFEVNGVSPDKGCSGIPAKGGDHVHWHLWNS